MILLYLTLLGGVVLVPMLFPTASNVFIRRWHGFVIRSLIRIASITYLPVKKRLKGSDFVKYIDMKGRTVQILRISELPTQAPSTVRFCAISDTHEVEEFLELPPCDVLLHCGDVSFQNGDGHGVTYAAKLNRWFGNLKRIKHKVVIAGNHDRFLEPLSLSKKRDIFSNATYLEHSSTTLEINSQRFRIHGSPHSILGRSQNTAFQYPRDSTGAQAQVDEHIPSSGVDILMTHGMPHGKCDGVRISHGCKLLKAKVDQLKPRVHVFGHRHQSYSVDFADSTVFINAASLAMTRLPEHPPVVFDLH